VHNPINKLINYSTTDEILIRHSEKIVQKIKPILHARKKYKRYV